MVNIFLLGDSIVTAYGKDQENIIGGWGDHLGCFFGNGVRVVPCANGGRSSRSYLNEGRFTDNGKFTKEMFPRGVGPCLDQMSSGDWALIEFCHNDDDSARREKREARHTPLGTPDKNGIYPSVMPEGEPPYSFGCGATYKGYLKFYIRKIREKGADPALVTPPPRGCFVNGKIASVPGNHGGSDEFGEYAYIRAIRQTAKEEDVPLIELFEKAKDFIDSLGEDKFKYLQSIKDREGKTIGEARLGRPGRWPEDYDRIMESGEYSDIDNTHQNRYGSYVYASFIAEEIKQKIPGLAEYLSDVPSKTVPKPKSLC